MITNLGSFNYAEGALNIDFVDARQRQLVFKDTFEASSYEVVKVHVWFGIAINCLSTSQQNNKGILSCI